MEDYIEYYPYTSLKNVKFPDDMDILDISPTMEEMVNGNMVKNYRN
jgi:hypothetical protein